VNVGSTTMTVLDILKIRVSWVRLVSTMTADAR